jgi:hypothetical protein
MENATIQQLKTEMEAKRDEVATYKTRNRQLETTSAASRGR